MRNVQSEPYSFDLMRIFVGDEPPLFFLEIIFRTIILFVYLIGLMRLMGQRGVGQLSLFEFALIIALGSAAGDPTFQRDVPILHGMLVILVIVLIHKAITALNQRVRTSQRATEGVVTRLVADGQVDILGLKGSQLAPDELMLELRKGGARYLEQVDRAYLETDGSVSVFLNQGWNSKGTSLMPEDQLHAECLANRLEKELRKS